MSELLDLEHVLGDLAASIQPAARKKLGLQIATVLRRRNAERIVANLTPDGAPMQARKGAPRGKNLRNRTTIRDRAGAKMFKRAASTRFLRREATADEARVGYSGLIARIMRVHQLGLRDSVERRPGAPTAQYPARPVLGVSADDEAAVLELIMQHLG